MFNNVRSKQKSPALRRSFTGKSVRAMSLLKIKGSNQNVRPTVFLLKARRSKLSLVHAAMYPQIPTS